MRTRLAALALTVTALGSIAAVASPANAVGNNTTLGGCRFNIDSVAAVTGSSWVGYVSDASATHDPSGLPIGATVSCKLQADGVDIPGTTFSYLGYGEQAGADPVSFDIDEFAIVGECQRTVYADGSDTGWFCLPTATTLPLPPPGVVTAIDFVTGVVNDVFVWDVDPRLCPALAAHPGTYGPIVVKPDGDVYVADPLGLGLNPVEDCPAYGNF